VFAQHTKKFKENRALREPLVGEKKRKKPKKKKGQGKKAGRNLRGGKELFGSVRGPRNFGEQTQENTSPLTVKYLLAESGGKNQ